MILLPPHTVAAKTKGDLVVKEKKETLLLLKETLKFL